jgi:hypothetical protein
MCCVSTAPPRACAKMDERVAECEHFPSHRVSLYCVITGRSNGSTKLDLSTIIDITYFSSNHDRWPSLDRQRCCACSQGAGQPSRLDSTLSLYVFLPIMTSFLPCQVRTGLVMKPRDILRLLLLNSPA